MAKWKLSRQQFGNEEFELAEGEVTIGRGVNNLIKLSSIVISRNHSIIHVKADEVVITDLKSSNGIYVGRKKISPNIPYKLSNNDIIGFGWTIEAAVENIKDNEKHVYKLIEYDNCPKTGIKRKLSQEALSKEIEIENNLDGLQNVVVDIVTTKNKNAEEYESSKPKKAKEEPILIEDTDEENEDLEYKVFKDTQNNIMFYDEIVLSDSDYESEHLFERLSQNSPGRPIKKLEIKVEKSRTSEENNSYSQIDDDIPIDLYEIYNVHEDNDQEMCKSPNDLPHSDLGDNIDVQPSKEIEKNLSNEGSSSDINPIDSEKNVPLIIPLASISNKPCKNIKIDDIPIDLYEIYNVHEDNDQEMCKSPNDLPHSDLGDNIDVQPSKEIEKNLSNEGSSSDINPIDSEKNVPLIIPLASISNKPCKNIKIMEPSNLSKAIKPSKNTSPKIDSKCKSTIPKRNTRSSKKSSTSSKKNTLTNSQKEERRNKLKEISIKEKEKKSTTSDLNTNTAIEEFNKNNVNGNISPISEALDTTKQLHVQNGPKIKNLPPPQRTVQIIDAFQIITTKNRSAHVKKPLLEKSQSNVNLPPKKVEKKVRFCDPLAEVHEFYIEPGKKMRSLESIKKEFRHYLIDGPKINQVSQKKLALMKILNWNTRWLEEQMKNDQPPPIIEKENLGILFLSFRDHQTYLKQVGNLLLLEIWEYITQGYKDNKRKDLCLTIESLPRKPPRERYPELFTICAKLTISTSDLRLLPRDGDIMIIKSSSESIDKWRFCFVYNVTYMSSSANIKTYSLSFYVKYSDQIEGFRLGEVILGRNIANINNVVLLFEAIERLATSPLRETILKPEPCQYPIYEHDDTITTKSKWTATLNDSQLRAVRESVGAARGGAPALRMVQGPPGTGKSSVICAMVMSYFYDGPRKKQSNRGKILICATSNAAVDELIIKLFNMLDKLRPEERFRMVRVGRLESMHGRARDISSQTLAQRELTHRREGEDPAVREQIAHYQAQMNRWKTEKPVDAGRAAYCDDRALYCARQIELLRGGEASPRQLLAEEHRLLAAADVIATTLSSAVNHKMRRVTGIELCIVDEAGQAIEPEALLPLMLGVTKLTLVGDPQQLPGFICSQRAKKYGLDKSLFSRLSSCSEEWESRPVVLLDRQYRMHPAIADYPSRAFYAGKVHSEPPAPVRLDLPSYSILAISGREDARCEARGASSAAAALALAAREHRPPLSVAVITPYVAHRDQMRAYLGDLMREAGSAPVEVNTVDSFQGQERDVVVVSVGRRRGVGFLADAGRMNVLLTRARHVLLVCLDPDAVREHEQWRTLVEDAKTKKLFKTLPYRMCQSSSTRRFSTKEMLKFLKN